MLADNHRQVDLEERSPSSSCGPGRSVSAVEYYDRHGRITAQPGS